MVWFMRPYLLASILLTLLLGIMTVWIRKHGALKGLCLGSLRAAWLSPLILTLFPITLTEPNRTSLQPPMISVFIDDSTSMTDSPIGRPSFYDKSLATTQKIVKYCKDVGCHTEIKRGSDYNPSFKAGRSPIALALKDFLNEEASIHVIFTDGGAEQPQKLPTPWMKSVHQKILIYRGHHRPQRNIYLDDLVTEPFGFTTRAHHLDFKIHRTELTSATQTVQITVTIDGKTMAAHNFSFESHTTQRKATLRLPLLTAGSHLIEIRALALPGEKELWDNSLTTSLEILPHSSGVLHLLGSPNADGRFLRRFLKLDPRFEVLSFFILRDPWDIPVVDQRSISLIPFPVDQLFTEELPHFAVVVMQNFRMSEFLKPDHQRNLVDYVLKGGSLMYIGGPRSFHISDAYYSSLSEILPFQIDAKAAEASGDLFLSHAENTQAKQGLPWYDGEQSFTIRLADDLGGLSPASSLATELRGLKDSLAFLDPLKGLHNFTDTQKEWQKEGYLPLMDAELPQGNQQPLISASFIGKGRVVWVFSDALWRIALSGHPSLARDTYNTLISKIFRWLSRDEKTPPISIEHLELSSHEDMVHLMARLYGPGVRYLTDPQIELTIRLCDEEISPQITFPSSHMAIISSVLPSADNHADSSDSCEFSLSATHKEFGEETTSAKAKIHQPQTDQTLATSLTTLSKISAAMNAWFLEEKQLLSKLSEWTEVLIEEAALHTPGRLSHQSISQYPYQIFDTPLAFFLFLAMPMEIWLRRVVWLKRPEEEETEKG